MIYIVLSLTTFGALFDKKYFLFIFKIYFNNFFSSRKHGVHLELLRCIYYLIFVDYLVIQNTEWNLQPKEYSIAFQFVQFVRLFHCSSIGFWLFRIFTCQDIYGTKVTYEVTKTVNSDIEKSEKSHLTLVPFIHENGKIANEKLMMDDGHNFNDGPLIGSIAIIIFIIFGVFLMGLISIGAMFFRTEECVQFYNDVTDFIASKHRFD